MLGIPIDFRFDNKKYIYTDMISNSKFYAQHTQTKGEKDQDEEEDMNEEKKKNDLAAVRADFEALYRQKRRLMRDLGEIEDRLERIGYEVEDVLSSIDSSRDNIEDNATAREKEVKE